MHVPLPAVAPGVQVIGSVPVTGWTFGAKFTRREPPGAPTVFVVEWIRKWHSAQMALPSPLPATSMSVPEPPASPLRCLACRLKFVAVELLLRKGSSP